MAKPEVSVPRFLGLQTIGPVDEGDFAELIVAENVQFSRAGLVEARRGFNWFSVLADVEGMTGNYLGRFVGETEFNTHLLRVNTELFTWDPPNTGNIHPLDDIVVGSGYMGVQYGTHLYLADGRRWDGTDMEEVSGFPGEGGPIEAHADRIWVVNEDRLYFSTPGNGGSWPAANFLDVEQGLQEPITELRSYQNRLYIFKESSLWVLETPGIPTSWTLRRLSQDGCFYQTSLEHEGNLYWFGARGAYRHTGGATELISEPIQNVWDEQSPFFPGIPGANSSYIAVLDDQLLLVFGGNGTQRTLLFNTKLNVWSEWVFAWQSRDGEEADPIQIRGLWSENYNSFLTSRGFYVLAQDGIKFFIAGQVPGRDTPEDIEYADTTHLFDDPEEEDYFLYEPVIQTKYADFDEPFDKKRNHQWMIEYAGSILRVDQYDEEDRTVTRTIETDDTSDQVEQVRIPGIGFFRKLSLKITFVRQSRAGMYLRVLHGRMAVRGPQIRNASEQ